MLRELSVVGKAINICLDKLDSNIYSGGMFVYKLRDVLEENPDFCERLIELDKSNDYDFTNDLLHDIAGLLRPDPHFLPRI